MGTSHSDIQNQDLFKQFKKEQWINKKDLGLYELWQNIKTGQLCEAYKLQYIPQQQDLQHYRFRHYNQNADNFVQIRYVDVEKKQSLCYHGESYVLTQFIPMKLTQLNDLSHIEAYSILRASYRAFHTMEAFHGPFIPNQDLIGINLNGKPKIWLNKNHSKNKADNVIKAQIWQKHMGQVSQNVKRIFEMVEQKLRGKHFSNEFRDYFYDNVMNFSQASQYVQEFCQQYRIIIPHTINYNHWVQDPDVIKIVNQYNLKRHENPLTDKLNTLQSTYQHERFIQQDSSKLLKRNQSHRNFTYHENLNFVRSPQYFPIRQENNAHINIMPATIVSPIIQRTNTIQTLVPLKRQFPLQHQPLTNKAGPTIIIPPTVGLRSTISVMPPVAPEKKTVENLKPIHYQNLRTPAHVGGGNITFIPPNKITQFEQPIRKFSQIQHNQKKIQKSEGKQSESIHEKIKQFQKDEHDYLVDSNIHKQKIQTQSFGHAAQLQNYINDNSKYQPAQSQEQNITSQPDWQNIQHQNEQNHEHKYMQQSQYDESAQNQNNQHQYMQESQQDDEQYPKKFNNQAHVQQHHQSNYYEQNHRQNNYEQYQYEQNNHHGQNQYEQYQYEQNHHTQKQPIHEQQIYDRRDISPIKQNHHKNTQEFQNHYAMFSKYAKLNQDHHQEPEQKNIAHSFQPRNINLNQSATLSGDDEQINNSGNVEVSDKNQQSIRNQQNTAELLQSSQRMHHLSSKNTSINRGINGQSSGTLIVHDSRQNIYQGVNQQQKTDKILITNIRQQSHQSQTQDQYNQQQYQNYQNQNQDQYYRHQQQFYQEQNQHNDEEQNQYQQNRYQRQALSQNQNESNSQTQQRNNKIQSQTRQQQQNSPQLNQYDNLHFRNQSQQLYQYTPVQSVYKNQYGQNIFGSFSRPQQSGVQEIVKLDNHQDIQEYIRNKYSKMIGAPVVAAQPVQKLTRQRSAKDYSNRAMTFAKPCQPQRDSQNDIQTRQYDGIIQKLPSNDCDVQRIQSLYERIDHLDNKNINLEKQRSSAHQSNVDGNDFLDVGNLEKSLDQKYTILAAQSNQKHIASPKNAYNVKGSQTMSEQDGMNVAALQQKLQKFQQRQSIERQRSQQRIQTQNDESTLTNNNELNFNQLENIVELMDKKIQQSQKKQNKSSQNLRQDQNISEFSHRQGRLDPLQNVELQTSISNLNNKELSLKDIPVLNKDQISNASNSIPTSKRDYYRNYGIDSEDFATGRASNSDGFSGMIKKQSSTSNKRQSKNYERKYDKYDTLTPVLELDRKYENYSSKNISTYEYQIPLSTIGTSYDTKQIRRKSSRRNTKHVQQAKRLADQISNKYDKYMNNDTSSDYQIDKPFAKKSYSHTIEPYDSSKYIDNSSKYISDSQKYISRNSQVSNKDLQRKRSSYLNPIQQLNGQNYTSPYKEQTQNIQSNQQNYLKLSNRNSKAESKVSDTNDKLKRNSKVSYDQLRDLLWK